MKLTKRLITTCSLAFVINLPLALFWRNNSRKKVKLLHIIVIKSDAIYWICKIVTTDWYHERMSLHTAYPKTSQNINGLFNFFPDQCCCKKSLPKPCRCWGLVIKNLLRAEINGLGWWRRPLVHKQACIVRPYMQTRVRAYLQLRTHVSLLCILSTYCGEGVRPSITAVKTLLYSGEGRPGPNTSVPPSDKVIWVPLQPGCSGGCRCALT